MSSRVRVSNKEWMSGLERTVSGMLTSQLEQCKQRQNVCVVIFNRYKVVGLSVFNAT